MMNFALSLPLGPGEIHHGRTRNSPHFVGNLVRSQRQGPNEAMYRRRRRRSSFARRGPAWVGPALIGVSAAVVIGLFVYFIGQSDTLAPAPQEMRVEVQDAFKE
jgi:hypothetical protein